MSGDYTSTRRDGWEPDGSGTDRPHARQPSPSGPAARMGRGFGNEAMPPPAMFDTELGQTFFRMRKLLEKSVWDMARLLRSEPTVVANLEAGALEALPPWLELTRIVETYGALCEVDTRPILSRLMKAYALTGPPVMQPVTAHLPPMRQHQPMPEPDSRADEIVPFDDAMRRPRPLSGKGRNPVHPVGRSAHGAGAHDMALPARTDADFDDAADDADEVDDNVAAAQPWRRRVGRVLVWFGIAVFVFAVVGLLSARMQPQILYAAASPWPSSVRSPAMAGVHWLVVKLAPRREGLVWVDAGDPGWRKADRLVIPGR